VLKPPVHGFLSKYRHKGLFTAFIGYLEFYIQQRPRKMKHDGLVCLIDLQSEYQEEQDWDSYLRLSKVINDYKVIFRQPNVSVQNIPTHSNRRVKRLLADRIVQLLLVQDYTNVPTLLLLLEKLRGFICTLNLSWESRGLYATVHQLVHFLNRYRNVLLSDDFDRVRGIVGLISGSIREDYPDISQSLTFSLNSLNKDLLFKVISHKLPEIQRISWSML
jgi:hypothetical protein